MEHMIIDLVEKTIERDQEARQVKEVKEKLFGRMGAAMGISPFGIIQPLGISQAQNGSKAAKAKASTTKRNQRTGKEMVLKH